MALGEPGYMAKCDELRASCFEPLRILLGGRMGAGWVDEEGRRTGDQNADGVALVHPITNGRFRRKRT